jgi:hypothetical protein
MSRKPRARPRGPKPKGAKPRTDRTKSGKVARKPGKPARGRLHPPAEEDLGGGDICSLEEKPSTEDNMPLPAHAPDSVAEAGFEDDHRKRALGAAAIALMVAVFGLLALLIVDHGLWERPYHESARAHAATEAAVAADGAFATPTRRPSLYSRIVRR